MLFRSEEDSSDQVDHKAIIESSSEDKAELFLNALTGTLKPTTMRLMAWIGKHEVSLLVDSGSSHNFVNPNVMKRVGMRGSEIESFDVMVANGEKLQCGKVVKINVQEARMVADLPILAVVDLNMILGNAWLRGLGRVLHNYEDMTMEFQLGGKKKIKDSITLDEQAMEICKRLEDQDRCMDGYACQEGLLYYKERVYVPNTLGLREEILSHFQ